MAAFVGDSPLGALPLRAVLPLSARRPGGPSLVPMPLLRSSSLRRTRLRGSACSLARDLAMGGRHNGAMNRSADGLHQAQADLELAGVSAAAGHHEWACFACHQAVEKALKGLHLAHGQQAWGHGLGRSWRDLPPAVAAALAARVSDLEDRLRILDALYIPTRYPDSLPDGAPTDHFGRLQSEDARRHARSIVDAIAVALA